MRETFKRWCGTKSRQEEREDTKPYRGTSNQGHLSGEDKGGGNTGLKAYGSNSSSVHLGTFACACFAHEVDGD